jgi:hypothetical protein
MTRYFTIVSRVGVLAAVAGALLLGTMTASAKSAPVATIPGPCTTEWITSGDQFNYPLQHPNGNVSVNMKMANGVPTLVSVCVEPGWTVESKGATDGVQLAFNYQGRPAIDFKYVLGKTDIRMR